MKSTTPGDAQLRRELSIRHEDDVIAIVTKPLASLAGSPGPIRCREFLHHVDTLAGLLPSLCTYGLNLCENRYLLLVSFCAIVVRGQTNLLPPTTTLAAQKSLMDDYPGSFIIHDGTTTLLDVPTLNLNDVLLGGEPANSGSHTRQSIDPEHVAALMFTSGSTGQSRAISKTWRTLKDSTQKNLLYFLPDQSGHLNLLATVPARHMWGFETSLLPALFADVSLVDAKPLFPLDVQDSLGELSPDCVLITSPIHLRAITASTIDFQPVKRLLCATAPLSQALALEAEQRFSAPLTEIFGCSEIGSIAYRDTVRETLWTPFAHIRFAQSDDDSTTVSSSCVPQPALLGDRVEVAGDGRFQLLGRTGDQIKVAGKRASLEELNRCLLLCSELDDGVIFAPPQKDTPAGEQRLTAMVVMSDNASPRTSH